MSSTVDAKEEIAAPAAAAVPAAENAAAEEEEEKKLTPKEMMDCVVELIKKGELIKARVEIKKNFKDITVETLEEMLKLSYSGTGTETLKHTINFVAKAFVDHNLRFSGYKVIYEEIKLKGHTTEIEILLLQAAVQELDVEGENISQMLKDLSVHRSTIIDQIVQEIEKKEVALSKKINDEFGKNVLNDIIPKVVDKFFTGSFENVMLLVQYSQALPLGSNNCFAIDAICKRLEKLQKLDSEQAFHLWAHAKYTLAQQENATNITYYEEIMCIEACEKLAKNKKTFFEIYKQLVDDTNKDGIKKLHEENWHVRSILPEFMRFYYCGNLKLAPNLIKTAHAFVAYGCSGAMLHAIYAEMDTHNQLSTFEAFQLFHELEMSTSYDAYDKLKSEGDVSIKDLEALKTKMPKCFEPLLKGENKKCRIVNRSFGGPLFSAAGDKKVFAWGPRESQEDQIWNSSIDEYTAMVTFFHNSSESPNSKLEFEESNGTTAATVGTTKTGGWMIKAIDDDFIKISNTMGKKF